MDGTYVTTRYVDSSPTPVVASRFTAGDLNSGAAKFGSNGLRTSTNPAGVTVSDASIVVGTGDFCYDFWLKIAAVGYEQNIFDTRQTTDGNNGLQLDYHPSYGLLHYSNLGGGIHSNGISPTAGVYQHYELSRTSGTGYLFLDGNLIISWADTNNYSSSFLYIGGVSYTPVGAVPTYGDWDEFRLLVGKGGHTSNFTPPTAAYSDV